MPDANANSTFILHPDDYSGGKDIAMDPRQAVEFFPYNING